LLAKTSGRIPTFARYCLDVLTGNIAAGRLVFLAIERHLNDLRSGDKRGIHFDHDAAAKIIKYARDCAPFKLDPFQQFIVGSMFGWKGADGFRRFRNAYVEMGKGNGKSPLAGGVIGTYGLLLDKEPDAEIYCAAVTKEQAGIAFRDALIMRDHAPALRGRIAKMGNAVKPWLANLSVASTNSFFRPISSEHRGLDGKRPHIVIIDEEHEHPSNLVVEKMRAGTKGRRQAMIFRITNSGYDRETVCFWDHEYSRQILEGALDNDSWFAYVCQLDVCDDCRAKGREQPACDNCDSWLDEEVWIKANPGLGTIIQKRYLAEQVAEALAMPAKQNIVQRLNFCMWTQSEERAISADAWKQCAWEEGDPATGDPVAWREAKLKQLAGKTCFGGLDLGVVNDFTCLALFFPTQEGVPKPVLLPFFWVPENAEQHRQLKERVPYDQWVKQGFLITTPGNVTDYRFVLKQTLDLRETFSIEEIAFDRMYATMLVQMLMDEGLNMVEHGQGTVSMSHPIKEFYRLITGQEIVHGYNPPLAWMIDNLVVKSDPNGNLRCVKPQNPNSPRKIDGAVASIMASGRAAAHPDLGSSEVFFIQ